MCGRSCCAPARWRCARGRGCSQKSAAGVHMSVLTSSRLAAVASSHLVCSGSRDTFGPALPPQPRSRKGVGSIDRVYHPLRSASGRRGTSFRKSWRASAVALVRRGVVMWGTDDGCASAHLVSQFVSFFLYVLGVCVCTCSVVKVLWPSWPSKERSHEPSRVRLVSLTCCEAHQAHFDRLQQVARMLRARLSNRTRKRLFHLDTVAAFLRHRAREWLPIPSP